jgi:hypothetical protein
VVVAIQLVELFRCDLSPLEDMVNHRPGTLVGYGFKTFQEFCWGFVSWHTGLQSGVQKKVYSRRAYLEKVRVAQVFDVSEPIQTKGAPFPFD